MNHQGRVDAPYDLPAKKGIPVIAMVALLVFVTPPVRAQGLNRFHQGNSLTGPLINDSGGSGGVIHALAVDAGFPDDRQQMIKNAGIPIDAIFNKRHNPTMVDDMKRIVRTLAPHDAIIVQPYGHQHTRRPETEADAAAFIYREALKYSPRAKLFVYYNWVSYDDDGPGATGRWRRATIDSHRSHFDPILDYLRKEFPGKGVYCLPVGQAMVAISDMIEAGKVPGLASAVDLFDIPTKHGTRRTVHPHARGYYLSGLVHFFSYYHALLEEKPDEEGYRPLRHDLTVGMPYSGPPNTIVNLTDAQAALFQRAAWGAARTCTRTAITDPEARQPNPHKTDFEAPTVPTDLRVVESSGDTVTISWTASTDTGGSGVLRYVVYVDGRDKTSSTTTTCTLKKLVPGRTYDLAVRAFDGQLNCSQKSRLQVTTKD